MAAAAAAACVGTSAGIAQQAPQRLSTLVVPSPAGGQIDAVARVLTSNLESRFGQKMIVENRPGAGGYTGAAYVARSVPDGQTLLMYAFAGLHSNVFVKDLPVDVGRTLAPIALLAEGPQFLIASTTVPAKTLPEFVAYAKKNPNKLNAAVIANTSYHLYTLQFLRAAGIELVAIPYNGLPLRELLAGEVQLLWTSVNVFEPHIKAGKVVVLAATSAERSELMPEIPTVKEQGINFEALGQNYAVFGPLGLNPEFAGQLNKRIYESMNTAAVREDLVRRGLLPPRRTESPEELSAKFAKEVREVQEAAARFGIKPQ